LTGKGLELKSHSILPDQSEKNEAYATMGLYYILIIIVLLFSSCSDSSIAEYEPNNQDEREITSLLIQYQEAKNHFNMARLLSFLHEKGEFSFECGRIVSKPVLKEVLPGLWTQIQSGNQAIIPIVHECINGDYFKSGELNNPRFEINNDTAEVSVLFTNGFCRLPQYFSIIRENDRWLITRTEWGHN
jgi:hypothetical protein